jgi:conjugative transfer pilus assembly protein TraH
MLAKLRTVIRRTAIPAAVAALCFAPAHANFMDDFMTSAGAAANVTPGSVIQGQSGTFISGGSLVWRVPNRTFTPFSFTPPSFKRGCGGIDFYGGSIGFINGEEFVNYLRGIIQTSMGSIFISALDALAPGLAKTMQAMSQDVQRMNSMLGSTCQMSQLLNSKTGIENDVTRWIQGATGQSSSEGNNRDFFSAYTRFKESLPDALNTITSGPSAKNSANVTQTGPRNATWAILHSGQFADFSSETKALLLSLIGTRVTLIEGDAANPMVYTHTLPGKLRFGDLVGHWTEQTKTLNAYDCGDHASSDPCLDLNSRPTKQILFTPYSRRYYNHLTVLRDAILNRTDPMSSAAGREALKAVGMSRLGAFRMIELTSNNNLSGISSVLIAKYAEIMGWEAAINHIENLCQDLKTAIDSSKEQGLNATNKDDIDLLESRRQSLLQEARSYRETLDKANGSQQDIANELAHLERTLYNNFNLRMANNLRAARRS